MTQTPDQPRRGRPPLPAGMAKVKRNIRIGPIWDVAEQELAPGETMTHFIETAMDREIVRRQRAKKRGDKNTPPA